MNNRMTNRILGIHTDRNTNMKKKRQKKEKEEETNELIKVKEHTKGQKEIKENRQKK